MPQGCKPANKDEKLEFNFAGSDLNSYEGLTPFKEICNV